jgi:hypothetical protein
MRQCHIRCLILHGLSFCRFYNCHDGFTAQAGVMVERIIFWLHGQPLDLLRGNKQIVI